MKRPSTTSSIFFVLSLTFAFTFSANAADEKKEAAADGGSKTEFVCSADVFFSWQRKQKPEDLQNKAKTPEEPIEVFYSTVSARAADEESSKKDLEKKLAATQPVALKACAHQHQSSSICTSERLETLGGDYSLMDFTARKAVLDAITEDCALVMGKCLSVRNGETTCQKQEVKSDAAPAAESSEKDSKGKKK